MFPARAVHPVTGWQEAHNYQHQSSPTAMRGTWRSRVMSSDGSWPLLWTIYLAGVQPCHEGTELKLACQSCVFSVIAGRLQEAGILQTSKGSVEGLSTLPTNRWSCDYGMYNACRRLWKIRESWKKEAVWYEYCYFKMSFKSGMTGEITLHTCFEWLREADLYHAISLPLLSIKPTTFLVSADRAQIINETNRKAVQVCSWRSIRHSNVCLSFYKWHIRYVTRTAALHFKLARICEGEAVPVGRP